MTTRRFERTSAGRPYSDAGVLRAMASWLESRPDFTADAIMVYPADAGWAGVLTDAIEDDIVAVALALAVETAA